MNRACLSYLAQAPQVFKTARTFAEKIPCHGLFKSGMGVSPMDLNAQPEGKFALRNFASCRTSRQGDLVLRAPFSNFKTLAHVGQANMGRTRKAPCWHSIARTNRPSFLGIENQDPLFSVLVLSPKDGALARNRLGCRFVYEHEHHFIEHEHVRFG